MGLTGEELENLDTVEGNEYERVTVGVVREVSFIHLQKHNSTILKFKTFLVRCKKKHFWSVLMRLDSWFVCFVYAG